ncbi:10653_t:CDS:2 [Gigaspora margarita]|uniref:10653_t:CDS:1 n=1 Tax=Gigaspora margarita TaxID=4874 RepID=A0ABM8W0Y3_GIGMA|nr:10653_t:CDS:2 [Gigaspora margarita]
MLRDCGTLYDLIEIPYDEDVNTGLLDNDPIFYYVLLVIDCATRYKDFIFLTSKSSEEVAKAFKSVYDNSDNPFNWARLLQCDEDPRFGHTSLAIDDRYAGSFELRVFKNQYTIEFLLPTGEHCTTIRFLLASGEWKNDPFERHRITDPIWSSSLHKIRRIVVEKNPPMPVLYYFDESGPRRPFVREQLMHIKEEPMLPPRWVLGDNRMRARHFL